MRPCETVEVRVRSGAVSSPVVGVVAADLAVRAGFDLDAVADLRMAVNEACSALLAVAPPGATLRCGFAPAPTHVVATATIPVVAATALRQDCPGWRVLTRLTTAAEIVGGHHGGSRWIGIRLLMDRSSARPVVRRPPRAGRRLPPR